MKMKPSHFEHMRARIAPLDTADRRAQYREKCTSLRAYQWYLVRAAGLIPFVCDALYTYLNDDHIQTALNRIVPTLDPIVSAAQETGVLVFAHVGD